MNLQYISDSNGQTTGVFIPIEDWELLKEKFSELNDEESKMMNIPDWHKDIVNERLAKYKKNPSDVLDWNEVKDQFNME